MLALALALALALTLTLDHLEHELEGEENGEVQVELLEPPAHLHLHGGRVRGRVSGGFRLVALTVVATGARRVA